MLALLEVKKYQITIDQQATGSGFIPTVMAGNQPGFYFNVYMGYRRRTHC